MSASGAKGVNSTLVDPIFNAGGNVDYSIYTPHTHGLIANSHFDMVDATPVSNGSFGSTTEIRITPNTCTYAGWCRLTFDIYTGRIATNTSWRAEWVDYLAFACIKNVQIQYGQNIVQTLTGEQIKELIYEPRKSSEERHVDKNFILQLPAAKRQANLLTEKTLQAAIDLPLFFTHHTHIHEPQTLGTDQRIIITWKDLTSLQFIDGGAITYAIAPAIQNCKLRYEAIYCETEEAMYLQSLTETDEGIVTHYKSFQDQDFTPPTPFVAGTNKLEIPLTNLNSPTQTLFVGLRSQEHVATPNRANPWAWRGHLRDLGIKLVSFSIKTTGGNGKTTRLLEEVIHELPKKRQCPYAALGNGLFIDFSQFCDALTENTGYWNFGGTSAPTLVLEYNVQAAEAPFTPRFYICAVTNNFVRNFKGNLVRGINQ